MPTDLPARGQGVQLIATTMSLAFGPMFSSPPASAGGRALPLPPLQVLPGTAIDLGDPQVDILEAVFSAIADHEGTTHDMTRTDPGNWTGGAVGKGELRGSRFGISAAAYPTLDIGSLTLDQAKAIFDRDYFSQS